MPQGHPLEVKIKQRKVRLCDLVCMASNPDLPTQHQPYSAHFSPPPTQSERRRREQGSAVEDDKVLLDAVVAGLGTHPRTACSYPPRPPQAMSCAELTRNTCIHTRRGSGAAELRRDLEAPQSALPPRRQERGPGEGRQEEQGPPHCGEYRLQRGRGSVVWRGAALGIISIMPVIS